VTEPKVSTRDHGNYVQALVATTPWGSVDHSGERVRSVEGWNLASTASQLGGHHKAQPCHRCRRNECAQQNLEWKGDETAKRHVWKRLIDEHSLVVWNSEQATRARLGAKNHSTIDLTLPSTNVELN